MSYQWIVIFFALFIGFLAGRIRKIDPAPISTLVVDFILPFYIFTSILKSNVYSADILWMISSAGFLIFLSFGFMIIIEKTTEINLKDYVLPVIFINSGYLGIPVIDSLFGTKAASLAVIYNQTTSFLIFTLGLSIIGSTLTKKERVKILLINPVLFSIILGILFKLFSIDLSDNVIKFIDFVGMSALPMAVITLGLALALIKIENILFVFSGALARFFLGLFFSALFIILFKPSIDIAYIIIVLGTMPSAVMSYLICEEYDVGAKYAANTVFLSTMIYPVLLFFIINILF